jgi:hypothetical protein
MFHSLNFMVSYSKTGLFVRGVFMPPLSRPTASQQIRTLLIVLGVGVISAFAFAAFLLHMYGPSGNYTLKDVLLTPSLLQKLSFKDQNPRTGGAARFVFDSMEFSYWAASSRDWHRVPVSLESYTALYNELVSDKSEVKVPEDLMASFTQSPPSSFIITVKTVSDNASFETSKVFQEIQFSQGRDVYRVELRDQSASTGTWAYFYHPKIQTISLKLLGEQ